MGAATSSPDYVWIKLANEERFGALNVSPRELVAQVISRACASPNWAGLAANMVQLYLVARAGEPRPLQPAIAEALSSLEPLAEEATLESAGVLSGAWLVAVPITGGGSAEAPPPAYIASLVQSVDEMRLLLSAHMQQVATKSIMFSAASPSAVRNLLAARSVSQYDDLPLPPIAHLMPTPASLVPFTWRQGLTETAASPHLLKTLERWVKTGATPALGQAFVDVQALAAHSPLVVHEPGVGSFRGVPDMAIIRLGVNANEAVSPLASCAVSLDWKTPTALEEGVKQQALLQVLGLSQLASAEGPPVFFTDLRTHFLCHRLVGEVIYSYEGAGGTNRLTLAEGVGLIRHFLQEDAGRKASRLAAAVAATTGGGGLTEAAAVQSAEVSAAQEGGGVGGGALRGGGGGSRGGGGGSGGGACDEDYGNLECMENCHPSEGLGSCTVAEAQAQSIADLQSITLALTHQLTVYGGINRKVFFQQEEKGTE